jgi:hypothetical protein
LVCTTAKARRISEDHHRDRRRRADIVEPEAQPVEVGDERIRAARRPAFGHRPDDRERVEDEHHVEQDRHRQNRPQQRQGKVPEHREAARAIDCRRLVVIAVYRLQPGHQDERRRRHRRPDGDADHQRERQRRVGQPFDARRDADRREQVVERAEIRLRHPAPEQADDDEAGGPRQQQQSARQRPPAESPVEDHRQCQRQDRGDDHHRRRPADGPPQRRDELPVLEQPDVVIEALEAAISAELVDPEQAHHHGVEDRVEHEHSGEQRRRSEKDDCRLSIAQAAPRGVA